MKESAEAIDSDDLTSIGFAIQRRAPNWRPLAEALMWASSVVVVDELAQDTLELTGPKDQ